MANNSTQVSKLTITLYPNPVNHSFALSGLAGDVKYTVRIYDLSGKFLLETTTRNHQPVSLQGLDQGLYMVEVESGGRREVFKVIRE